MSILSRESLKKAAYPIGIAMTLFQLYYTVGYGVLEGSLLAAIFLSFALTMIFLTQPAIKVKEGKKEPVILLLIDLILVVCSIATSVYLYFNYEVLQERMAFIDEVPQEAMALAYILVGLSLEATRRMTGLPLFTVAIVFFAYFLWGDKLPSFIRHNGATLENIAENMYLTGEGVYGIPIMLACNTLFAFMMFGAFLEGSNMSSIFMDLAYRLTRKSQGGPAKVAIFASALFGTISGSSAGNVYTTGVFTIPLMKKCGYQPHFAGAVEAVASTGGQIMPPVMGAAAFMMAEFCNVPYLEVAKAALLPAVLYYLALWVMIHFEARRRGLGLISSELVPSLRSILTRIYYLIPLVVLVVIMLDGRSAAICANMATGSILLLSFLRKDTRFTFKRFLDTLYAAASSSLMVVACCAASGIVVGVINYTGIGFKFINVLTNVADGHLFVMLVLLMITSFILGMGMPTTPAYIVVATLGAPALIKMGLAPLVAHMFCFYYAILSFITPPVCVAAYAGANIAEADPMKTGFTSMKLGVVAFVVPIMFVYEPSLLWQGDIASSITATITAIIGVIGLSGALQNWLLRSCTVPERALLLIGGLCLFYPGFITDVIGLACMGFVIVCQYIRNKKNPIPAVGEECTLPED
ncbi:TRAP transporter permease [uncultured Mailhella sp.]|uniref:TRAP transporter permease n=1 Tax=uncultured Mailhella sp. TaxID=1981031 RepID=UPI0025F400AF|nr:TRAP transporter permease [uncultured Mailhella sp.]